LFAQHYLAGYPALRLRVCLLQRYSVGTVRSRYASAVMW